MCVGSTVSSCGIALVDGGRKEAGGRRGDAGPCYAWRRRGRRADCKETPALVDARHRKGICEPAESAFPVAGTHLLGGHKRFLTGGRHLAVELQTPDIKA